MLVLDTVLHGVGLVVDELPGVPRDVVLEHVLALHRLQLHPEHFDFDLFQFKFFVFVLPLHIMQIHPVNGFFILPMEFFSLKRKSVPRIEF